MTREESLSIITEAIEDYVCNYVTDTAKAQKMLNAIQTLEQEPCDDAISRQASAKEYCAECDHVEMCRWYPYEGCEFRGKSSTERKGKWIADIDRWGDIITTVNGYRCSECNVFNTDKDNYCPNCGAKMVEEQESEVKHG